MPSDGQFPPVGPPSADPDDVLVPFGAPEADTGGSSPKAKAAHGPAAKPRRSRKALRPLLWSLPFVLIGLAASTYLIGLTLWSRASLGHWTDSDYASAQAGYEGQKTLTKSGVEPWVANYNLGTTMLREGDTDGGIGLLRTAKEQVPTATEVEPGRIETYSYECQVRINLALGIEIQGDAKAASADWSGAATAYSEAKDIISPCQSPSSSQDQSGDGEGQSDQQSGGQGGGGGQSDQQSGGQGGGGGQQDPGEQADRPRTSRARAVRVRTSRTRAVRVRTSRTRAARVRTSRTRAARARTRATRARTSRTSRTRAARARARTRTRGTTTRTPRTARSARTCRKRTAATRRTGRTAPTPSAPATRTGRGERAAAGTVTCDQERDGAAAPPATAARVGL